MVPKQKQTKYDPEVLEEAVMAVRNKTISLRAVAKHYKITVTTLSDKVHGSLPIQRVQVTLLTEEEERRLSEWILAMSRCGFGNWTDDR